MDGHDGHDGHAGHGGHEGHDMPAMCSMNMLFNWQIQDVCVVYEWWHIHSALEMFISCLVIFAIAAGYEYLRAQSSTLDQMWYDANAKKRADTRLADDREEVQENEGLLQRNTPAPRLSRNQEIMRSTIYAILVAISFWLMLVFMTYNGFLMIAVVLGAGFGHFIFGRGKLSANRSIQCH